MRELAEALQVDHDLAVTPGDALASPDLVTTERLMRLEADAPFGHWRTRTFIAGRRIDDLSARLGRRTAQ